MTVTDEAVFGDRRKDLAQSMPVEPGSMLGRMNETSNLKQRLAVLLRDAERAHGDYEKSLGHRDEEWPDWYAAYIAERL
jgi:hypothetical protein